MKKIDVLIRYDDVDGEGYNRQGTAVRAFADLRAANKWNGDLTVALREALDTNRKFSADSISRTLAKRTDWPEWAVREFVAHIEIAGAEPWYEIQRVELDEVEYVKG